MTFSFNGQNAAKAVVSQMGGVIRSISGTASNLFKTWFTGEGPLASFWSTITASFDAVVGRYRSMIEEKPLQAAGIGVGIVAAAILLGPAILGHVGASTARAAGKTASGIVGGIKKAIASVWRS